jgi:hypothetical protein
MTIVRRLNSFCESEKTPCMQKLTPHCDNRRSPCKSARNYACMAENANPNPNHNHNLFAALGLVQTSKKRLQFRLRLKAGSSDQLLSKDKLGNKWSQLLSNT